MTLLRILFCILCQILIEDPNQVLILDPNRDPVQDHNQDLILRSLIQDSV